MVLRTNPQFGIECEPANDEMGLVNDTGKGESEEITTATKRTILKILHKFQVIHTLK